mgnify:FL=1
MNFSLCEQGLIKWVQGRYSKNMSIFNKQKKEKYFSCTSQSYAISGTSNSIDNL